jgi:hypothetical protein
MATLLNTQNPLMFILLELDTSEYTELFSNEFEFYYFSD